MLLTDAADWAAFDAAPSDTLLADGATRTRATAAIAQAFWAYVWPRIKDDRLKVSIWFLRPSVKVVALKPWFELVFGEGPTDA